MTRPGDPRLALYAEAVLHRLPWQVQAVIVDGEPVNLRTIVVEALRAADDLHLLLGGRETPEPSSLEVDGAARLLATGSPRYDPIPEGLGWRAVLHAVNLQHAYRACMAEAVGQAERDRYAAAYAVLQRHLTRPKGAYRRGDPHDRPQSTTVGYGTTTTRHNDGGGDAGQGDAHSLSTGTTAASPSFDGSHPS